MPTTNPLKTVGGVDYTNSILYSMTNGRTDGQTDRRTDRQGLILMPPDYRHGGIKNKDLRTYVCKSHRSVQIRVRICRLLPLGLLENIVHLYHNHLLTGLA